MKVIKPLYGIAEAGTHWWSTYFKHYRQRLCMITSSYDPCLLLTSESKPFGIVGMQTDDTLILCDDKFSQLEETELQKAGFTAKPKTELTINTPLLFNGCTLTKTNDSMDMKQKNQGEKLDLVTNADDYRVQRARGAYIASICQPEACFDLSAAA